MGCNGTTYKQIKELAQRWANYTRENQVIYKSDFGTIHFCSEENFNGLHKIEVITPK